MVTIHSIDVAILQGFTYNGSLNQDQAVMLIVEG